MPDRAYMLPSEWEDYEKRKNDAKIRADNALQAFLEFHPEYTDNAWTYLEVENHFEMEAFHGGIATCFRLEDNKHGTLDYNNFFGIKLYYDFRPL